MANKIQFKRGLKTKLPALGVGEPAFCTDTNELFVGGGLGNVEMATKSQLDEIVANVRSFGAKGDGVTDDSHAIQACIDSLVTGGVGGTVYFPKGKYLLNSQVTILINDAAWLGTGINLKGDSSSSSILECNVIGYSVVAKGIHGSCLHVSNLGFRGKSLGTSRGLQMSNLSEQYIENVFFNNLFMGCELKDCVRTKFVSCTWSQNSNGIQGVDQSQESTPNAIEFIGCTFYGNSEFAAYFYGGCNINFFGGTIEVSGYKDDGLNHWGVRFDNSGRYGGVGCNFYGTYFEGNATIADVWINNGDYSAVYNFSGCTFNKFEGVCENINNIYISSGNDTTKRATVVVTGCSFQDRGNTPSETTKYIQLAPGGTPIFLEERGNYYQSQVQIPSATTNNIYATAKFVGLSTTPGLWEGYNISGIVKNGTGDYTITFKMPSVNVSKITMVYCGQNFYEIISETISSIRLKVVNYLSEPIDPPYITLISTQA